MTTPADIEIFRDLWMKVHIKAFDIHLRDDHQELFDKCPWPFCTMSRDMADTIAKEMQRTKTEVAK